VSAASEPEPVKKTRLSPAGIFSMMRLASSKLSGWPNWKAGE